MLHKTLAKKTIPIHKKKGKADAFDYKEINEHTKIFFIARRMKYSSIY